MCVDSNSRVAVFLATMSSRSDTASTKAQVGCYICNLIASQQTMYYLWLLGFWN